MPLDYSFAFSPSCESVCQGLCGLLVGKGGGGVVMVWSVPASTPYFVWLFKLLSDMEVSSLPYHACV